MWKAGLLLLAACGRIDFAARGDAGIDAPADPCDPAVTDDLVALYTFDAANLGADSTTRHDATVVTPLSTTQGPCGTALVVSGGHLIAPDSTDFDLVAGSVDLFARVVNPATGTAQLILSRDALNTNFDGHFSIAIGTAGSVFTRLQRVGAVNAFRCSPVIQADRWIHIATSFGPQGFRLWVDGVEAVEPAAATFGPVVPCNQPHGFGTAGNDNTLVIGASNSDAADNSPTPMINGHFVGAIDHVRVRSTWRDFTRR